MYREETHVPWHGTEIPAEYTFAMLHVRDLYLLAGRVQSGLTDLRIDRRVDRANRDLNG